MSRRGPKPALIVAVALGALIVVPFLLLMLSKRSGADATPRVENSSSAAVDYDLQQLVDRATDLLAKEIPAAVRRGDVTLDSVAGLERLRLRAEDAVADGKPDRARKHYAELVARAEADLNAATLAAQARALQDSVLADLRRMQRYRNVFEQTYAEAVGLYDEGLEAIADRDPGGAVAAFEAGAVVLKELENRATTRIEALLDEGESALENYAFEAARSRFEEVLRLDDENRRATAGLERVEALAEIGDAARELEALEASGRFRDAMEALDGLDSRFPGNPYLAAKRAELEKKVADREFTDLVAASERAEAAGDYEGAIEALENALEIRPEADLADRLAAIEEKRDAARLEQLLSDGYEDLSDGRFEQARERYREALALAPESAEAKTGFEKASSLYFASLRFRENLANAGNFLSEGRFPLAAKFFNDAMASRPATLPESVGEREMREELERQSREVPVVVRSDKRTYVSLIGVFPPDRFSRKDLPLFPDVYILRGTRKGYRDVEVVFKVNARNRSQEIEVVCRERE